MRLFYRGLLLLIIIGTCGCDRPRPLTSEELPTVKHFYGHVDYFGGQGILDVHVIASNRFVIGDGLLTTNITGVSSIVLRKHSRHAWFPFRIWAKKEAPFEDIWRVMETGATNRSFELAVRDSDVHEPKLTLLPFSGRASNERLYFIGCGHPLFMESTSNLVIVVCDKYHLTFNNSSCRSEDLGLKLWRVKRTTTGMLQILILATGDCPYQQVIDAVDACNEGAIYLGLLRPSAPLPEIPREEKNE